VPGEVAGEGPAVERPPPGQHQVQDRAEAVQSGARVDPLVSDLLGRDVGDRADDLAYHRQLGTGLLDDAEVHQLHAVIIEDHDVGRGHVTVHPPMGVDVFEGASQLNEDFAGAGEATRWWKSAPLLDLFAKIPPAEVFHREVGPPLVQTAVIHLQDVGVLEAREGTKFASESFSDVFIPLSREHELDRTSRTVALHLCFQYDRHTPPTDLSDNFVLTDDIARLWDSGWVRRGHQCDVLV